MTPTEPSVSAQGAAMRAGDERGTPRTDAEAFTVAVGPQPLGDSASVVDSDFARTLERELHDALRELGQANELLRRVADTTVLFRHGPMELDAEVCSHLSALPAATPKAERQDAWIPVGERLPDMKELYKDGPKKATVIGFNGHWVGQFSLEETFKKRLPVWKNWLDRNDNVTHWQPLPKPPTALSKSGGDKQGGSDAE